MESSVIDKKTALRLTTEAMHPRAKYSRDQREQAYFGFLDREELGSTGLGNGLALPHIRLAQCDQARLAFGLALNPIPWESVDNIPVRILVALIISDISNDGHLRFIAQLASSLADARTRGSLLGVKSTTDLMASVSMIGGGDWPDPRDVGSMCA